MFKKSFLIFVLFLPAVIFSQNLHLNTPQNENFISNFKNLSIEHLLDTAGFYFNKNITDTALVYYNIIINTQVKETDIEQQMIKVEALNKAAILYYYMGDYIKAYELLIRALQKCEKTNNVSYESKIYNSIGNIYARFKKDDIAKSYYLKALSLCDDSIGIVALTNNLGVIEREKNNLDSAYYLFNKSLHISKQHNNVYLYNILNHIALNFQKKKQYDSAFYYYRLSLKETIQNNEIGEQRARNFSNLGNLFFEINKKDSALYYITKANSLATENNFLGILSDNYLTMSKIEESKGNIRKSFEYYKNYSNLKDSVFGTEKLGEINQLQRLYEMSKTNQQIEQLITERQINEQKLYYQRIIWYITLGVLLLVSIVSLIIFFQKRTLNKAYRVLFEKNIRIIELQENSSEKYKRSTLTDDMHEELLDKILILMEDTSIVCDPKFSIDILAGLVNSNHTYVSQVINNALKKNFRSFINGYRIQEAQRLFSEPDAVKYTIESTALQVGFKSQSAFRDAFKEITGVSPNFYLKSMQEQNTNKAN